MTPQAIRDGFDQLRSEEQMQGLADAARSRSEADWLVGINGTRAMTAFNSQGGGFFLTTVGRVQTPTLSLVVEREEKIRKFISRDYWEIHASFAAQAGPTPASGLTRVEENPEDAEQRADRVWSAKPRPRHCRCLARAAGYGDRREPPHHPGAGPAL
jgi:DNA topoisomerase-3